MIRSLPFKTKKIVSSLEKWRIETFWHKEPETLRWINQFSDNGVFVDVGANLGLYSLYAASIKPNLIVLAFEAQLENFASLCENIAINNYCNIVPAYIAIGSKNEMSVFTYNFNVSGATGGFVESSPLLNKEKEHWHHRLISQNSLDKTLSLKPWGVPVYLKIDIDGREQDVIDGASEFLKHVSEILIEVDIKNGSIAENQTIINLLNMGFGIPHELNNSFPHSRDRRLEENIKVENVILKRT